MNAKNVLLILFCVVGLTGICGTTDPPTYAEGEFDNAPN